MPVTVRGARVALRPGTYADMQHRVGTVVGLDRIPGRPYPLTVNFDGDQDRCVYPHEVGLLWFAPSVTERA